MKHRVKKFFQLLNGVSYYPEFNRKTWLHRFCDIVNWYFKYHEVNKFYNLYGQDISKANNIKNSPFQDYESLKIVRDKNNHLYCSNSQTVFLRDKFVFYKALENFKINTPKVFAFVKNGHIYDENMNEKDKHWLNCHDDFFFKDNNGECASYVKHVSNKENFEEVIQKCEGNGEFICQEKLIQHPLLSKLNPSSINTIRLVTVNNNGKIQILSTILRIGTSKTGCVDNWAKGGIAVGVDEHGKLKQWGFYKPTFGTKTEIHPDTGVTFLGFELPYFEDAVNMAIQCHKHFYNIQTIGWDIAITEDGPSFIEGNDNWEISLMQVANGGLKQKWEELSKN